MSRPVRAINPAAKLKDAANASVPELAFQRQAVQEYRSSLDSSILPAINSHTRSLQAKRLKRTIAVRNDTDEEDELSTDNPLKKGMLLYFTARSLIESHLSQKEQSRDIISQRQRGT
jgi:hypothetical protein